MTDLYVGMMSGTSADGVDTVVVDFSTNKPKLIASHYRPYEPALRQQILELCRPGSNEIHRLGELDVKLAQVFAESVTDILKQSNLTADAITAIGSHGQTVRHSPDPKQRYTLQIGDPNTIAARTGITTVADFRRKDIALGGQGAPLVPAFHQHLFAKAATPRAIVNIGGIANITLLTNSANDILGFDTGPGNALMDEWIHIHCAKTHDTNGEWAASGKVHPPLLTAMLADPYFALSPPKSTGREYFNQAWLQYHLVKVDSMIPTEDVQTTLAELTAVTIMDAIKHKMPLGEVYICGGGAHNAYLLSRLQHHAGTHLRVATTETLGIHPDWVEAVAFAWLAFQTVNRRTGNLPSVTGARQATILGGLYYA